MRVAIFVSVALLAALSARLAGAQTAEQLLQSCEPEGREIERVDLHQTVCRHYLSAVASTHQFMVITVNATPIFCAPDEITRDQVRRIFVKWATGNPEYLHYGAVTAALAAFSEAYPCADP